MDSNEPTAWQDINPPMVSARRHAPPSPYSVAPASSDQFRNELAACLTLVAPVGMTEEARRDWFAVAWGTLKHLPADLLEYGCKVARETCDHPSKIVPTIFEATAKSVRGRQQTTDYVALPAPTSRNVMDRRGKPMSEADTAKLNEILESLGATARYRSDGSRYTITTD